MFTYSSRLVALAAALSTAIGLSGCSRSISVVKASDAPNAGFKIGQLFDHKTNCASSGWSQSKDGNDRPVVEFECDVRLSDDFIRSQIASEMRGAREAAQYRLSRGAGGATVPGLNGSLGESHASVSNPEIDKAIVDDAVAVAAFADLERQWKETAAQLETVDAECRGHFEEMLKTTEVELTKQYAAHRDFKETLQFVLKDEQIVQIAGRVTTGDAIDLAVGSDTLYSLMLAPNGREQEERTLSYEARQKSPPAAPESSPGATDFAYCGHPEKYEPLTAKFDALYGAGNDAWTAFKNRQRQGGAQSVQQP